MHDEMTDQEYDANKRAVFYPAIDAFFNNDVYAPPCTEIDGAQVYSYAEAGALVVSIDLETAGEVYAKYGEGDLVPVVVHVNGKTVFAATQLTDLAAAVAAAPHEDTIAVRVSLREYRPRTWRNLFGLLG